MEKWKQDMTSEQEFIREMGMALYKIRDAAKVASDLDSIGYALYEAAGMQDTKALRTIVRALAQQVGECVTTLEGIRDIVDKTMSMPEAED